MKTKVIHKIAIILLFVITGIFSNKIYAKHTYVIGDLSVTYDHCAGTVTLKFLGYYDVEAWPDDNGFGNGKLYITVGSNDELQIGSFGGGDGEYNYTGGDNDHNHYSRIPLGSVHQDVIGYEDAVNDRYFYWEVTYDLWSPMYDDSWGDNITFRITGTWDGSDPIDLSKSILTTQTSPPTDLTALNDESCYYVELAWNNPGDNTCSSTVYQTEIYKDGVSLDIVPFATTTYNDASAVKGQAYDYKIRARLNTSSSGTNRSAFTPVAQGKRIGPFDPPSSVAASNNNCEGLIDLSWQWNTANPKMFQFQRSEDEDFNSGVFTYLEINGDLRTYEDTPPIKNVIYYYRMKTKNSCDDWSLTWSSTADGIAPYAPAPPSDVTAVASTTEITVTWTDNSASESGFIIERSMYGGGGSSIFEVGADITTYVDNTAANCQRYSYEIKSKNDCELTGVPSGTPADAKIYPDLSATFTASKKLKSSKGYYTTSVKLEWTNDNTSQIDYFKIYRKIYGSTNDSVLIASENSATAIYNDDAAEPGVYYQYFIQAESDCEGEVIKSNISSDIGFRSPTGIVNGHIDYTGGIAVKDANVLVTKTSGNSGSSLVFDGTTGYLSIPHKANLIPANNITIEAWVRPSSIKADNYIVSKGTAYEIYLDNKQPVFRMNNGNMDLKFQVDTVEQDYWRHLSVTYDGDTAKIYVNGELKAFQAYSVPITSNTDSLFIGTNATKSNFFAGNVDEVRIWNTARTDAEIIRDYRRILNGDETGIVASWGFDENIGEFIFDRSKVGIAFNENHGYLKNGPNWSTEIPTSSQLGYTGITDINGDYTINGIRYALAGENFKLTPVLGTHEFTPSNRVIFIGTGSSIHNNQDFEDISAFDVSGNVKFAGTSCPVKDIILQIDGQPVIKSGMVIMTDADGNFSIKVPIGEHQVSVMRNGHEFSQGIFPPTGYWDFKEDVTGIQFIDTTLVTVVGRVVGGLEQQEKSPVLGRCENNIGQATIDFITQNSCFSKSVETADSSGQYIIELPPMKYIIPDFSIPSNPVISFDDNDLLDLTINYPLQTKSDTLFIAGTDIIMSIDSVSFHRQLDFIYREVPKMNVTNGDGTAPFIGDESFVYISMDGTDTTIIDLDPNPFPFPVFSQNVDYTARIEAYEIYTNKDGGIDNWALDTVPITQGLITITNELAYENSTLIQMDGGDTLYTFKAGTPNVLSDVNPLYDYTKVFRVQIEIGANTVEWKPLSLADGEYYRAYILGSKSADGNSFVTNGPEVVDFILRDPPGSGSFTSLEIGSTSTFQQEYSLAGALTREGQHKLHAGTEFVSGVGFAVGTEMTSSLVLGWSVEAKIGASGEFSNTITMTETKQTSAEPEIVGAQSDLFIGKSVNMEFGLANGINITAEEVYTMPDIEEASTVINYEGRNFSVARRSTLMIVPGGYETGFVYDRHHIENFLIPNLQFLRNQFFVTQPTAYLSYLPGDHENYGTNNDDPVWEDLATSSDPVGTETADLDGSSYRFTAITDESIDSVRVFNQQIRLWQAALGTDEEEKALAIAEGDVERNISINAGPVYTYSSESTRSVMGTAFIEFNVGLSLLNTMEATVGGVGTELEQGFSIGIETSGSISIGTESSTTYTYEITDPDIGDYFTVDVYKSELGHGPMFYTRAGQTCCPYEGGFVSEYYEPGTPLSLPTLRREVPTILVDGASSAKLTNTPADQAASFSLTLGNESEASDDMAYVIKVLEASNPHGAIVKMDGVPLYREIIIPAGTSISKTLTIEKGPGDTYEYDSILVLFHSPCQYFTYDEDIADSAYVSAHFIPTCSNIEIINPDNQWVVNSSFNDTLNTIFADYDINYAGLEEIKFWYKPSSQSSWIGLETWYKDTTGMNNSELKLITTNDIFTLYQWDLQQINDGYYDIKTSTTCTFANKESEIFSGIMDRINPHPFGNPSPVDGILSPDDEIMIKFNEPVDLGLLSSYNFSISGVLNGTDLRHDGFLYFDGVDDYVEIANGLFLNGSFSMEFWIKRDNTGVETVISQGINANQSVTVGFDASDKMKFTIAGISMTSDMVFDNKWHHVVCSYNKETNTGEIFCDGNWDNFVTMITSYDEGGKILIGKSTVSASAEKFKGNMHEFRIWNKALDLATIVERMNKQLSGTEFNLVGCWQMNEATGKVTADIARHRNGVINGSTWVVEPSGRSQELDGTGDDVEINSGTYAFTEEMDFTIEFWFKGDAPVDTVTFFSNGRADRQDDNSNSWMIFGTSDKHIRVMNDSVIFDAVKTDYFDNKWHHFALVISRIGNTYSYIDGDLQNTMSSNLWLGLGGAKFWLGSRGWFNGVIQHNDKYFTGFMDEVRIWNLSRKQEQISRDRVNRLSGNEYGLIAYYPFEKYTDIMGVLTLTETLENIVDNSSPAINGNPLFSTDVPTIKLERPVQSVPFTYSVNNDEIIFTPTIEPSRIENVTLDITTRDVKDLQGNSMASPKTWIAFVDKNQVIWQDQERNFKKEVNQALAFQADILNTGGELKTYSIKNIPDWLTVDSENGTIAPNSFKTLNFEIDPSVNIGNYEEAIYVVTDFGYNEALLLKLNVFALSPDWDVNPEDFQFSMNVIGQLKINNVISTDTADILAAFVGDECRGVAKLKYVSAYDMYEAYLSIFSNTETGENVIFRIWNASEGIVHLNVTPDYIFSSNIIEGSPGSPVMISTSDAYMSNVSLPEGWKWISFNLANDKLSDVNATLSDISAETGDLVKGQTVFDVYSATLGWQGSISGTGGFDNKSMYMVKMLGEDTLLYTGAKLNPAEIQIPLNTGWNWIGYTPSVNLEINDAFGNYNPATGDLIKSQYAFAMYDPVMGWLGDLTYLIPGQGYMFKTSVTAGSLVYPITGMYKGAPGSGKGNKNVVVDKWQIEKEAYQFNMSLIAEVDLENEVVTEKHIIGAFAGDDCRGIAKPILINGKMLYFITIYANTTNEAIIFKLADLSTDQFANIEELIKFIPNDIRGKIDDPYQLNINSTTDVNNISENIFSVYPNPTSDKITISLKGLENMSGSVFEITDITGRIIHFSNFEGVESFDFSHFEKGIYFLIVKTGKGIFKEKIVVQ